MKIKSALLSLFTAALFFLPTGIFADIDETEEYIISLEEGVTTTDAFIEKYDLIPINEEHGIYVTSEENAEMLENHSKVDIVEENSYVTLFYDYNDTYYNSKQKTAFDHINGSNLNSYYVSNMSKVVVIDTGFNFNHEDKGINILPGSDIVKKKNSYGQYHKTTKDYFSHGTACAGVIGAQANNYRGIAGIFNNCYIYVSCIFHANDKGDPVASDAAVCAAIYDAVDNLDADVLSMSFGQNTNSKVIADAIQYAYDRGVLLIAASGNTGDKENKPHYPASCNGVISVANASGANSISASSTYNQYVDVAAPGTNIYTLYANNGGYASFNGTSLATPFVAALAAYAKGVNPNITPAAFEWYLLRSARDISNPGKDDKSGYGMIDCQKFHTLITGGSLETGEPSAPFIINNATELEIFISILNNGDTDACAKINQSFTVPANFKGYTGTYNGTFNGGNHRISGLTATFIDTLGPNGRIQNLYAKGTMKDEAILVRDNQGTIYACVTEGSLTNSNTAGAICAVNHGNIYYALNRATVTGAVAAGIAPYSYGTIDQTINRGQINSTAGTAAGVTVYLQNRASVTNSYNASGLKGISSLGGVIHTMASGATVKNCYYGDSKQRTVTHNEIVPKTFDYMQTRGFLCMLNGHGGYYKPDDDNANNGYPVWGSSDINTRFYDVAPHKWSADDIYALAADQILNGRSAGYFIPEDNITRAEFLTILAKITGIDITENYGTEPFYDVNPGDWYYNVICWAYNCGLTQGNGNGSCTPTANITREEISAFIVRYIKGFSTTNLPTPKPLTFSDSYNVSAWARNDVSILSQIGIINGFPDGSFGPKQSATREQAAKMTNAMRNEI